MLLILQLSVFILTFKCALTARSRNFLDEHYSNWKRESDQISFPNRRRIHLYSRNSGRYVQVLANGKVVAKGIYDDKYADILILTRSYGKIYIKGITADRYVCFDRRGRLISRKRPSSRCTFRQAYGHDAFTIYRAEKLRGKFLAFSKSGNARGRVKNRSGTKAVQFVERPKPRKTRPNRYYRGKEGRITPWMLKYHKSIAQHPKKGTARSRSNQPDYDVNPFYLWTRENRRGKKHGAFIRPLKNRRRGRKNRRKDKRKFSRHGKGRRNSHRGRKRVNRKNRGKARRGFRKLNKGRKPNW